jgi:hypothetical protein
VIAATQRQLGSDGGIVLSVGAAFCSIVLTRMSAGLAFRVVAPGTLVWRGEYFSRVARQRIRYPKCMAWTDQFWKPIKLADGRVIKSLADARALMSALPDEKRESSHWRYATDILARAASSPSVIDDALSQTLTALKADGLVGAPGRRAPQH